MSTASVKSQLALKWSIDDLAKRGKLRLWTFTLPCVLPIDLACKRWSDLCRDLVKECNFTGVRVFELHETHGLHVHVVTCEYYPVARFREIARRNGWGRIHVCRCNAEPYYIAKYVSKGKREGAFDGRRLWAAFGCFAKGVSTRVMDVESTGGKSVVYRVVESEPWLMRHRARGGRLMGPEWQNYIRRCNHHLHSWLRGPITSAQDYAEGVAGAQVQLTLSL